MPRFTEEQIMRAKSVNLEQYLLFRGEQLKRAGSEYKWIYHDGSGEHDSVAVRENQWFDHKNQVGGNTIGFLQEYYGFSFTEAVKELLQGEQAQGNLYYSNEKKAEMNKESNKEFTLPTAASNMKKTFAYLLKTRFIDKNIVQAFVDAKAIYQEKEYDNIVFIGFDENGQAVSGQKKSTNSFNTGFKATIANSNTEVAFGYKGNGNKLFVFEAPVDLLSFLTIHPENWKKESYIALDGLSPKAMFYFLEKNPHTDEIHICVDSDEAGIEAASKFKDMLIEKGYSKIYWQKPLYKDWNEMLKAQAGLSPSPAKSHPQSEQYSKILNLLSRNCTTQNKYIQYRTNKFNEQGMVFMNKILDSEYKKWNESLQIENCGITVEQNAGTHLLIMADVSLYAAADMVVKNSQVKEVSINHCYENAVKRLICAYKPYQDKEKLRTRTADIEKEYQSLQKLLIPKQENKRMQYDSLLHFAGTCMRTNTYLITKYETELEQHIKINHSEQSSELIVG